MKKLIASIAFAAGLGAAVTATTAQAQQEGMIGEVRFFAGNFAPRTWAFCNGQLLPIAQNTALFSILGTMYGGDGRTTFALPDARGRVLISPGRGPGLSDYRQGSKGGAEQIVQTLAQLASHTHTGKLKGANTPGAAAAVAGAVLADGGIYASRAAPDTDMAAGTVVTDATGGSQGMNNIQPFVTANCIISLQGVYPSRS